MKHNKTLIILLSLTWLFSNAQDAKQMISRYKLKLYEEKKLKPIQTVKMTLEITTEEGKFPATMWLMEDMVYKLEMQELKGKSTEYLDLNVYKLLTASGETKVVSNANTETHFRKKIWLNFYPFLHTKDEFPITETQSEAEIAGAAVASIAPSSEPIVDPPNIKKYVQILGFNEMKHIYYLDMIRMIISKIVTVYYIDGVEKKDEFIFQNIVQSPEGYSYSSVFNTVFGEATVKSIQFNRAMTSRDLTAPF